MANVDEEATFSGYVNTTPKVSGDSKDRSGAQSPTPKAPPVPRPPPVRKPPPSHVGLFLHRDICCDLGTRINWKPELTWNSFTMDKLPLFKNETWTKCAPTMTQVYQSLTKNKVDCQDNTKMGQRAAKFMEDNNKVIEPLLKTSLEEFFSALNGIDLTGNIMFVWITGSAITGTFTPNSDLDVTVLTNLEFEIIHQQFRTSDRVKTVSPNPYKDFLMAIKFKSGVRMDLACNNVDAVRSSHVVGSYETQVDSFAIGLLALKRMAHTNGFKEGIKSYTLAVLLIFALEKAGLTDQIFRRGHKKWFNSDVNPLSLAPFGIESGLDARSVPIQDLLLAYLETILKFDYKKLVIQIHTDILPKEKESNTLEVVEPFHHGSLMKPMEKESAERFVRVFFAAHWKCYSALRKSLRFEDAMQACYESEVDLYYGQYIAYFEGLTKSKKLKCE